MCEGILLRIFLGLLHLYANVAGTLWLDPPKVVVHHGDSVSVNCSTNVTNHLLDWEKPQGTSKKTDDKKITWTVEHLTEWGTKPFCYMIDTQYNQHKIEFNIIIYKTPDRVSISTVGHTELMIEGGQYELQCDIQNVAPVEFLTISPSRDDDGVQYRCEAELDLGPEGPQLPLTVTSEPLNITVCYPPVSISELHNKSVDFGYDEVLKCSSDAWPRPQYRWEYIPAPNVRTEDIDGVSLLYIDYATGLNTGTYKCTATNKLGETSQSVRVDVRSVGNTNTSYP
ncbi:opioid-binding protein/cell adhesion molecule-like isoform X2 [Colossoma macropomum]|uniref:opioid-binding protein/cell adhesion molecule-like isoform X2 n=1 Tax=Colossoma macropomum TaxID=42526 RepID=UPI0018652755|nr:opioid-binding protein/cell adhesion molecule-like isoform X2 [Colossoma macropomum]